MRFKPVLWIVTFALTLGLVQSGGNKQTIK
ncbi:MAG: hypothetical protein CLLPBCKN_007412 [Chroococcidiopsis cubana SAG 39.79]|nr:hypothetical protein [Chroococcidiopsis cubana SAG 39.79]